jgi:hypothetical protein
MVTKKQIEWLKPYVEGIKSRRDDPPKYTVYTKRIRKSIDERLELMLELAMMAPEIFRDEEYEIQEYGAIKHRRLKILLQLVKAIEPESDPVLIKLQKEVGLRD